jgi:hypothetical protein
MLCLTHAQQKILPCKKPPNHNKRNDANENLDLNQTILPVPVSYIPAYPTIFFLNEIKPKPAYEQRIKSNKNKVVKPKFNAMADENKGETTWAKANIVI